MVGGQREMLASMKEHKATINAICIREDDSECVSASDDGSCIVWDLTRRRRRAIMMTPGRRSKAVSFFPPDESQIVTCGSDNKITYWDAHECGEIRELEGSKTGGIFSIDISADGSKLVSGGGDKVVWLWDYDVGSVLQVGLGHSGGVQRVKFSPDANKIVSVGDEGGIFIWDIDHRKYDDALAKLKAGLGGVLADT